MGFLDGLRGGQYLGFSTQNVPIIDITKYAPLFTSPKVSSGTDKSNDTDGIKTFRGETENYNDGLRYVANEKADAHSKMVTAVETNNKDLFIESQSRLADAYSLETELNNSKLWMEQNYTALNKNMENYEPTSTAWIKTEGDKIVPVGFKGKSGSSLIDSRYLHGNKSYNISEMSNYWDDITKGSPNFDPKTGHLKDVPERVNAQTAFGVPKGTDSRNEILEIFNAAQSGYSEYKNVLINKEKQGDGVYEHSKFPLYGTDIWSIKTRNNDINIETAAGVTWNMLSSPAQLQEIDNFYKSVSKDPEQLNYLSSKLLLIRPEDLGEGKTIKDAKNYIKDEFDKTISDVSAYKYGAYTIIPLDVNGNQVKEDSPNVAGYKGLLVPVDINKPNADELLRSLVTEDTLPIFTEAYVGNKANDLKGVYSQRSIEEDLNRYLIKQAADTNVNIGDKVKVSKMNTLSGEAIPMFAASADQGTRTSANFNFGNNSRGVANIKLNRVNYGNAYTLSEHVTAPTSAYIVGGNNVIGAGSLSEGWEVSTYKGEVSNMPLAIRYDEFNDKTKIYYNNVQKNLEPFGLSNLIGGGDAAYNDFINDPNSFIFSNTEGNTYLDIIDNSNLNPDEKLYVANVIGLLNGIGHGPGTGSLDYKSIKDNAYYGRNYNGTPLSNFNYMNVSDEVIDIASDMIDYGGMVYQYKQMKENSSGLRDVNIGNKIINQNAMYLTESDVMIDNLSVWNNDYGLDTPYFRADMEYDIGSNPAAFLALEVNVSGTANPKKDTQISALGGNNYSLDELVRMYKVNVNDINKIIAEDINADQKINKIIKEINDKTGGGLAITHNYKTIGNDKNKLVTDGFITLSPNEVLSSAGGRYEKDIHAVYSNKYGNIGFDNFNNLKNWLNSTIITSDE